MAELVKKLGDTAGLAEKAKEANRELVDKVKSGGTVTSADFAALKRDLDPTPVAHVDRTTQGTEPDAGVQYHGDKDTEATKTPELPPLDPEDVDSFHMAVLHNTRFTKSYSRMGGKLQFTFRSRTSKESLAALAAVRHITDDAKLSQMEFQTMVGAALLSLQVAEIDGVSHPEVPADELQPWVRLDGQESRPDWYGRIDKWLDASEALVNILNEAKKDFESTYSRLCNEASMENF